MNDSLERMSTTESSGGAPGEAMHDLIADLYPICRSITGDGLRKTLRILQDQIPITIEEVPSGTKVLDWTIPKEWNIRDAYIKNERGERVVDFQASNLHVVNYSVPVQRTMTLGELRPHLHTLPDHPDWIPYRTSYYNETWGFCLRHHTLEALPEGTYEVCIDSTLEPGALSYGEYVIPGETNEEVLFSCHTCHPSLCNDNLSGVALCTFLAKHLRERTTRYTYRFLFIPGTIGAITWLDHNEKRADRIKHGLVVACVGDSGPFHYKQSRRGDAEIDRVVQYVLEHSDEPIGVRSFTPYGYDERQYCSPGFNLPVGSLTRTPHGRFPEYHTSADDLDLVTPDALAQSLDRYLEVVKMLEANRTYLNTNPKGEPQLGRRGLYRATGGHKEAEEMQMAMLWTLNLSDGSHALLDVAEAAELPFKQVHDVAQLLSEHDLLTPVSADGDR
jgi:aminopeptidase-like protein